MVWLLGADRLDGKTVAIAVGLAAGVFLLAQLVAIAARSKFAIEHKGFLARWPQLLRPDTEPPWRPDPNDHTQREAVMYVRSILVMRIFVGVAGVLLPIALFVIDRWYFHGNPSPRDSMSAYYWSGMHDVFVTIIFGTGAFLVGYKIIERSLDNFASIVAGLGALCLAWFQTKPGCLTVHNTVVAADCKNVPLPVLTPLEQHWNALESAGGFKLVDPDGLLAEAEYDLGIIMREDPLEGDLHERARRLANRTGLDVIAIWEWGVVEQVSTGLLGTRVGLQPIARQMLAAADQLAALQR